MVKAPSQHGSPLDGNAWKSSHGAHAVLAGILILGLAVRLWGIDFGLPYEGITYDQVSGEESKEVFRAFKLGAGEYVWHFGKGGMYLILFVEYGIYYVLSLLTGAVDSPREFAMNVLADRTTAYLIGRVTVAVMGVLTCLVAYAIGRRLYSRRVGLLAACLGAFAYFHVQSSTVINVDIGAALAVWTSVLFYLIYESSQKIRWLVVSGAAAAVAIAFKLPAGIVIPLIWAAILSVPASERRPPTRVRRIIVFSLCVAVTLTVVAPEWLVWAGQLFGDLVPVARAVTDPIAMTTLDEEIRSITTRQTSLSFRYLHHLVADYNVVSTCAAALGFVTGIMRRNRWDMLLGGFVIVYIAAMMSFDWTQPERYLMPIIPALWLLGARFLADISEGRSVVLVLGLAALLALPVYDIARAASERSGLDTRLHAKAWIERNVPSGSRLLIDGTQFRNIVGPPLNPDEATLERQLETVTDKLKRFKGVGRGVDKADLGMYVEATGRLPGPRYELHSTTYGLLVQPLGYYFDNCFDYVVTSSYITAKFARGGGAEHKYPKSARFYRQLDNDARVEKIWREAPVPWRSSGPVITIYRLRHTCANHASDGRDADGGT